MSVGSARATSTVEQLRHVAEQTQPAAIIQARQAVTALAPGATVRQVDSLWLDNSMTVAVTSPAGTNRLTSKSLSQALGSLGQVEVASGAPAWMGWTGRQDAKPAPVQTRLGKPPIPGFRPAPPSDPWNLDALGVPSARRAGLTGKGVRIGVIDNGVDVGHPSLSRQAARSHESPFTPGTVAPNTAGLTIAGYGTYSAGVAVGTRTGVAPGAALMVALNQDPDGFKDSPRATAMDQLRNRLTILHDFQWMMAPTDADGSVHPERSANVTTNAWGTFGGDPNPASFTHYDRALDAMAAAGIVNVFAAGNRFQQNGDPKVVYPARLDSVIAVGGTDRAGRAHPESATEGTSPTGRPKPDILAPAVDTTSALVRIPAFSATMKGAYVDTTGQLAAPGVPDSVGFTGTSHASPEMAGAVALLDEALAKRGEPFADVRDVKSVLGVLSRPAPASPGMPAGLRDLDLSKIDEAVSALIAQRHGDPTVSLPRR